MLICKDVPKAKVIFCRSLGFGIVIETVSVQSLLGEFGCVPGKDTLRHFPLFYGLGKQFKIKAIKISSGQQYLGIS